MCRGMGALLYGSDLDRFTNIAKEEGNIDTAFVTGEPSRAGSMALSCTTTRANMCWARTDVAGMEIATAIASQIVSSSADVKTMG